MSPSPINSGTQPVASKGGHSQEFVSCLGDFFRRNLISIKLNKKSFHSQIQQRSNIRAATLELDTSAYPNIEYIAGNRLSIYPVNPSDHVQTILKHLSDDIWTPQMQQQMQQQPQQKKQKLNMSQPWQTFVQLYGKDSLRLALMHLYDITTAPSRDLLRIMAECCSNKEQRAKLLAICRTDDSWEKWLCQSLRTLKSTLEEFSSCSALSAKSLISELTLQQPRQYSISSIKSSRRFRAELVVFQHKFGLKQVASVLASLRDREESSKRRQQQQAGKGAAPSSPVPSGTYGPMQSAPISLHVNHHQQQQHDDSSGSSAKSSFSIRSLRSMPQSFGTSPISTQQVKRVPSYSGPLMSLYASSTMNTQEHSDSNQSATATATNGAKSAPDRDDKKRPLLPSEQIANQTKSTSSERQQFDGNRERPIMMIGQDVGLVAFKPFWQQRALEHDRAQIFYTLFKDLSAKKFGDMQLVCLTGSRAKVEDLFRRDIQMAITNKIISSNTCIQKSHLITLLDQAALSSATSADATATAAAASFKQLPIESKELLELGKRICKLLIDNNGCIYTCCDAQMTQAIEILIVESLARHTGLSRSKIMSLIPKWKGRKMDEQLPVANNKFLYTLENPFERAQIVQEIYESSI